MIENTYGYVIVNLPHEGVRCHKNMYILTVLILYKNEVICNEIPIVCFFDNGSNDIFYQKCAEIGSFFELLNDVLFLNSIFERRKLI